MESKQPTLFIMTNGTKISKLNGKLHRLDGPAIEWPNGDKAWYVNGKLHREDGPAIEYPDGSKHWFLEGDNYTFIGWNDKVGNKLDSEAVYEYSLYDVSNDIGVWIRSYESF